MAKRPLAGEKRGALERVARTTLLAAGLTVARFSFDADAPEPKLFSSSAVDRLQAPITRFHD